MKLPRMKPRSLKWQIFRMIVSGAVISSLVVLAYSIFGTGVLNRDDRATLYDAAHIIEHLRHVEDGQSTVDVNHWVMQYINKVDPDIWFVMIEDGEIVDSYNAPNWALDEELYLGAPSVIGRFWDEKDGMLELVYELQFNVENRSVHLFTGGANEGQAMVSLLLYLTIMPTFLLFLLIASLFAFVMSMLISRKINKSVSALKSDLSTVDFDRAFEPVADKRTPKELQPLLGGFNDTLEKLHETYGQQRKFATELTHELRTPIAAVMAQLQSLEPSEPNQNMLNRLTQLHGFIGQLLDRDRLRWADEARTQSDLVVLVRDAAAQLAPLAIAANRNIKLSSEQPLVHVVTDATAVSHVVHNLIANAILHGAGEISISIESGKEPDHVSVSVGDEGNVLNAADIAELTQAFRKGSGGGSGLGLSIAHNILQKLGGSLSGRIADQGTEFTLTLPYTSLQQAE